MVTLLRRSLVIAELMFWQGGFMFYSSVVVPVGTEVLGSHLSQGFVTRQVTNYLNLAGLVAVAVLAWDAAVSRDIIVWRRRLRWTLWSFLVATLAAQWWLHIRLDDLLDAEHMLIIDRSAFRAEHQVYLLVTTAQWVAAMAALVLTLCAWRIEDASDH